MNFFSTFRYFLLYRSSLLNLFLLYGELFPKLSYIYQFFFMIYQNILYYIYSFLEKYVLRSCFFIIFISNEIFKILFTKMKFIRYYYFVNSYIIYWNRGYIDGTCILQIQCHLKFFYPFLYMVLIILIIF